MDFNSINWLAVLVAALSSFLIGGIWYSPLLFANAWMKDSGLDSETLQKSSKGRAFGFTFLFSIIMAANLAMFLADGPSTCPEGCITKTDVIWGTTAGFLAGIWTFCAIAIHSLFELKSWRHIFINGGYSLLALTLMGAIIGAWR